MKNRKEVVLKVKKIIIEGPDGKEYKIKKGKIKIYIPFEKQEGEEEAEHAADEVAEETLEKEEESQTISDSKKLEEVIGFKVPEVPEGFSIVEERCKKNTLIAHNEEFGYITYVPTLGKNGGWTNTYEISENPETGKIQSKAGFVPWTNVSLEQARKLTQNFFKRFPYTICEVCYNKDWDAILKWLKASGTLKHEEIYEDSRKWGNYWDNPNSTHSMLKTGENEEFTVNGINNFTGNTAIWVQDNTYDDVAVIRGGSFHCDGSTYPASYLYGNNISSETAPHLSFRVVFRVRKVVC